MIKARLKEFVMSLRFTEAKKLVSKLDDDELENVLLELSLESESIIYYSFVQDMLKSHETAMLHYIASILMSQSLKHLKGAYLTAFYHAKKAVDLTPNDSSLKEYLLYFNDIPEKLLSDDEARKLADEILTVDPENDVAKKYV